MSHVPTTSDSHRRAFKVWGEIIRVFSAKESIAAAAVSGLKHLQEPKLMVLFYLIQEEMFWIKEKKNMNPFSDISNYTLSYNHLSTWAGQIWIGRQMRLFLWNSEHFHWKQVSKKMEKTAKWSYCLSQSCQVWFSEK